MFPVISEAYDRDASVLAGNGGSAVSDISELVQPDDFRPIENTGIFASFYTDEVRFSAEEGNDICHVPVCISPDDEIGAVRLSYEYDGVGMNCIDQKFIPAGSWRMTREPIPCSSVVLQDGAFMYRR